MKYDKSATFFSQDPFDFPDFAGGNRCHAQFQFKMQVNLS